jgi:hypothetical protein
MLLNEFLKQPRKTEAHEHKLAAQYGSSEQNAADRSAKLLPRSTGKKLSIRASISLVTTRRIYCAGCALKLVPKNKGVISEPV